MPHSAAPAPETGQLEIRDGRLTIVPDNAQGLELGLDWETGMDWSFDSQPAMPAASNANLPDLEIDDDDVAVIAGCGVNELPRLVGAGSVQMKGVSMTFTGRLIVVSTDLIYGFQQVHGTTQGQTGTTPIRDEQTTLTLPARSQDQRAHLYMSAALGI